MKKIVQTDKAPKPLGPYSQGVIVDKFLFVSGQVAIDPEEGKIVANDIRGQTIRVMENIEAILQAAGYDFSHVIQTNVYLSSIALFGEFNKEYGKYFDGSFPARATVGIELMPNALVEISVIAYME